MPDPRLLMTARLLRLRAAARWPLLATIAATIAVAVATAVLVLTVTGQAADDARAAAPAGIPSDDLDARLTAGATALASSLPSLFLTVGVVAAVAVAQLGRLLAAAREHETDTARARGLSRRQVLALGALEAGVVGLVGAVGGGSGAVVLALMGGPDAAVRAVSHVWVAGVGAALLAGVLVAAVSRQSRTRRRAARVATGAGVVLLLAAAALCVWQLGLARAGGFDPIVAVAPTVLLGAAAVLALALFGLLARLAAAPSSGRRSFGTPFASRQLARRLPLSAVAVLLVALTVAQAILAASFAATWTRATTSSAALRTGADLRVDLDPQDASPADVSDAAAIPGATAAAGAVTEVLEFGGDEASLVALPAAEAGSILTTAGGAVDPGALVAALTGEATEGIVAAEPLPLRDGATSLSLTLAPEWTGTDVSEALQPLAVLLDDRGTVVARPLALTSVGPEGVIAEATLPEGTAPWALAALVVRVGPTPSPPVGVVRIAGLTAGGEGVDVAGVARFEDDRRDVVAWLADGRDRGGESQPPERLRVVVSDDFADRFGVDRGDALEYRVAGTGRRGEIDVKDVVPAIPGASSPVAVFATAEDLLVAALQRGTSFASPTSIWVSAPTDADAHLSAAFGDRPVRVSSPGVADRVVGALIPGWWIATVGAAALALIALVAIVQTLALARAPEVAVLRALGVTRQQQARGRAAELAAVLGGAVALGALLGAVVAASAAVPLVRATTPGILPGAASIEIAWLPAAGVVSVLVAGGAVIVLVAAARVRRAARRAVVGEEAR
jgi:hypothetical protein